MPETSPYRFLEPIFASYQPKSDITAFELAQLLPYLTGKHLYPDDWERLGMACRHLVRQEGVMTEIFAVSGQ